MSSVYQTASQTYRINQVNNASPLDLLLMAYDAALVGCAQHSLERTANALTVLRNALDYNYDAKIAMGFYQLYQYCAELTRQGEFDQAATILRELRDSWAQVKAELEASAEKEASAQKPITRTPNAYQHSAQNTTQLVVAA